MNKDSTKWQGKYLALLKDIGMQLAQAGNIICPYCREHEAINFNQPLAAIGDYEYTLFCPHCELKIELVIDWHPDMN